MQRTENVSEGTRNYGIAALPSLLPPIVHWLSTLNVSQLDPAAATPLLFDCALRIFSFAALVGGSAEFVVESGVLAQVAALLKAPLSDERLLVVLSVLIQCCDGPCCCAAFVLHVEADMGWWVCTFVL